ncbi:MAG: rhodanese-like domain-containing protein [Bacteroidota bacterium]
MKTSILPALIATFLLINCGGNPSQEASILNADQFEKMMNESQNKIVLDVRTPGEFETGFISGAVLMNFHDADFKEKVNTLDKSRSIFVYCESGVRSNKASVILKESGFEDVYLLTGGLKDWRASGKSLSK